jgi:hypothetical protein
VHDFFLRIWLPDRSQAKAMMQPWCLLTMLK